MSVPGDVIAVVLRIDPEYIGHTAHPLPVNGEMGPDVFPPRNSGSQAKSVDLRP